MNAASPDEPRQNQPAPQAGFHWSPANLLGFSLVAMAFILMAAWSWRKWPDAIVDFGTQLYIPWRLNHGAVLYRDLYYFAGGPVSQYFNALLFQVFGTSLSTLIFANLAIAAAFLLYVYRCFLRISDTLTATVICLSLVFIFLFSEYTPIGNYNFITPYSHEAVHGTVLSLLAVGLLTEWLMAPRLRHAALTGFLAGVVFLTKPDVFVALMAAVAIALRLHFWKQGRLVPALKFAGCFLGLGLLPLLFFLAIFSRAETWHQSLHSLVFGWVPVFIASVRNNLFYRTFIGLDEPLLHLKEMSVHFACVAAIIFFYAALFRRLDRWKIGPLQSPWIPWLVTVLPLLWFSAMFPWNACGTSLPFWCLAILIIFIWQQKQAPLTRALVFPLLWTVFALVLMAKLGLLARIWHYGFVLGMPAFVITVYFLLWHLPRNLETSFQVPAKYMRGAFLVALLAGFGILASNCNIFYSRKNQPLGHGGDTIMTYSKTDYARGIAQALDWIEQNLPPDATLAVVPSGITLNFLTRHANSTPCLFWDPNSMAVFGQRNMTAQFEAQPPDYILLIEQNHNEFGVGHFGSFPGYGVDLMQWIRSNYQVASLIGSKPLTDGRFGLEFLKRFPSAPDTNNAAPNNQMPAQ